MSICPLSDALFLESLMRAILFSYNLKTAKRKDFFEKNHGGFIIQNGVSIPQCYNRID
jgi:hypothetical protein